MVNIANVAQASRLLRNDKVLTSGGISTVDSEMKASWNTMISCTFSLLFPYIHDLFIMRDELQTYITREIEQSFNLHHAQNTHIWAGAISAAGGGMTNIGLRNLSTPELKETAINKVTRPTQILGASITGALGDDFPDLESGTPSFQQVLVYAKSRTNKYLV